MDRKLVDVNFSVKDVIEVQIPFKRKPIVQNARNGALRVSWAAQTTIEENQERKNQRQTEGKPQQTSRKGCDCQPRNPSKRKVKNGQSFSSLVHKKEQEENPKWVDVSSRTIDKDEMLIELDMAISSARSSDWASEQRPYSSDPRNRTNSMRRPRSAHNTSGSVLHNPITARSLDSSSSIHDARWNVATKSTDEESALRPQIQKDERSQQAFQRSFRSPLSDLDAISVKHEYNSLMNNNNDFDWLTSKLVEKRPPQPPPPPATLRRATATTTLTSVTMQSVRPDSSPTCKYAWGEPQQSNVATGTSNRRKSSTMGSMGYISSPLTGRSRK
jgi:hypothetical protein